MEEWGPVSHLRMRDPLEEEKRKPWSLKNGYGYAKSPHAFREGY